jgi:N-acetyl-gamma-glutamylphosphate reductase
MKALIIGATGATGKDLLQKLIDDTLFGNSCFRKKSFRIKKNKFLNIS